MAYGQKLRNQLRRAAGTFSLRRRAGNRIMPNWWNSISVRGPSRRGRGIFSGTSARMWRPCPTPCCSRRGTVKARCGFAVGDYTALGTVFHLFAFRAPGKPRPARRTPFWTPIAARRHPARAYAPNLGLGINPGIVFFKRKWNATILRPHVETSWAVQRPQEAGLLGSLKKLFGM